VEKGTQGQASEILYGGGRESMGVRVAAIGKAKQCPSIEAFTGGRKSTWDTVVIIEKVNSVCH
jgi:hypothetical protein